MSISKDIKRCPYCGCEEYYIKQSYSGTCNFYMRFDGKEADNTQMYDGSQFKNTSKYAWCSECNRRLFKIDE